MSISQRCVCVRDASFHSYTRFMNRCATYVMTLSFHLWIYMRRLVYSCATPLAKAITVISRKWLAPLVRLINYYIICNLHLFMLILGINKTATWSFPSICMRGTHGTQVWASCLRNDVFVCSIEIGQHLKGKSILSAVDSFISKKFIWLFIIVNAE